MQFAQKVFLAIVINVLAGFIVAGILYVFSHHVWLVAIGLILVVCLLGTTIALLFRFHESHIIESIGIKDIRRGNRRVDFRGYPAQMGTSSFWFWGISAKRLLSQTDIVTNMVSICKTGGDVRLLLLSSTCDSLKRRAAEEGEDPKAFRQDIESTLSRVNEINTKNNVTILVRTTTELPVWRLLIHDDKTLWLTWFHADVQGADRPQVVVSGDCRDSLFWPLRRQFLEVWEKRSRDALCA